MDSSVSPKDEIWFLRVCQHISTGLYQHVVLGEVRIGPSCLTLIGVSLQSVRTVFLRCGYDKTAGCCDLLARLQGTDAVNKRGQQVV